MFQSTHPRGVRPIDPPGTIAHCIVSIHAPTRGATLNTRIRQQFAQVSIHAPTRGATLTLKYVSIPLEFQSTHPRGVRRPLRVASVATFCFNPRTHEGCDCAAKPQSRIVTCFNPRTHEGCDTIFKLQMVSRTCFNPRTHEGCDSLWRHSKLERQVSIHAPTRGATM